MTPDDLSLLQRYVAQQDADAFSELIRRHGGLVYGVARRVVGNHADAEDVVQETFIDLLRQAGRIRAPVPAWLHTVAYHRALDLIRSTRRRGRHEVRSQVDPPAEAPAAEASWQELLQEVDAALDALPESVRAPIIMHYLEGQTNEAIASSLGIAVRTVSARLDSGLKRLRDALRSQTRAVPAIAVLLGHAHSALPGDVQLRLIKIGLTGWTATATASATATAATHVTTTATGTTATWWLVGGALSATVLTAGVVVWHPRAGSAPHLLAPPLPLAAPIRMAPVVPAPIVPVLVPPGAGWRLTFTESFTGTALDRSVWTTLPLAHRMPHDAPAPPGAQANLADARVGWLGGHPESHRPGEAIVVHDGQVELGLSHVHEARSAMDRHRHPIGITTQDSFAQQDGWFEIQCTIAHTSRIAASFALVPERGHVGSARSVIDLFGGEAGTEAVFSAGVPSGPWHAHHSGYRPQSQTGPSTVLADGDHSIACAWVGTTFRWYIDHGTTPVAICQAGDDLPMGPSFIALEVAPLAGDEDEPSSLDLASRFVIRRVVAYQRDIMSGASSSTSHPP